MSRTLFVPLFFALITGSTLSAPTVSEGSTPRGRASARCFAPMSPSGQPLLGFTGAMIYGQGLEVQFVNPGSLAQQIGLESGDLITAINGQPVSSLPDYYGLLRDSGGVVDMELIDVRGTGTIVVRFYLDNGTSGDVACAPGGRTGFQQPLIAPQSGRVSQFRPQFRTVAPPMRRPTVIYRNPGRW